MKTNTIAKFFACCCFLAFAVNMNAQQSTIKEAEKKAVKESTTKMAEPALESTTHGNPAYRDALVMTKTDKSPEFPCPEEFAEAADRKQCADNHMLTFLYGKITYPAEARAAGTEGVVVIKFIVEKDGSITNPEVVRSIGGGCDEESIRVINEMPKWIPGERDGQPVSMYYHMPVKFKLQ